ncbi:hypothetical protein C7Y72_21105 [Paraconexibacter algicola]|uniref:Uncharacterized protein n=1 Tax=Paraconexibacter algicola TaxID=2133960 RepID=A0A2T4UBI9_9ACTN|nr:hypothetical protein C7Y72_21105 [Paraconexibacter algicola]
MPSKVDAALLRPTIACTRSCHSGRPELRAPSSSFVSSTGVTRSRTQSLTGVTSGNRVCSRSVSRGSSVRAGLRVAIRPGSSAGRVARSSWSSSRTVPRRTGGATRRPGRRSWARRPVGGSARSIARSAGGAVARTVSSSRMPSPSARLSAASAPDVRAKPVTRPPSASSLAASAPVIRDSERIVVDRSWVRSPRAAFDTIAMSRRAGTAGRNERPRSRAPPSASAVPASSRTSASASREGRSNAPLRIWSNCTGSFVALSGIVPPSRISGALGLPGLSST